MAEHIAIRPGLTASFTHELTGVGKRPRLSLAGFDDEGKPFVVSFYGKAERRPGEYSTPLTDLIALITQSESGEKPHE